MDKPNPKKPRFSKAAMLSYLLRRRNAFQALHQFDRDCGTAQLVPKTFAHHDTVVMSKTYFAELMAKAVAYGEARAVDAAIDDIAGDYV